MRNLSFLWIPVLKRIEFGCITNFNGLVCRECSGVALAKD